jgi:RsiW-degrading membrane proteinase PrsW (M82 family)
MATPESVSSDLKTLTKAQQQEVVSSAGIPFPASGHGQRTIWMVLLLGLIVIALGGLIAGFILSNNDKESAAAWALSTAAAGGLVGLIAPSPTSGGGNID